MRCYGDSQEETQQLTYDKDELLGQVVSLQQQFEASRAECSKLVAKVSRDLEGGRGSCSGTTYSVF